MRKPASWMNKAADPVLEFLDEHGLALPVGAIVYNLQRELNDPPSESTIKRAVYELEDYGLVEKPANANTYYQITDLGRSYLAGNLDAGTLKEA